MPLNGETEHVSRTWGKGRSALALPLSAPFPLRAPGSRCCSARILSRPLTAPLPPAVP